MDVDDRVGYQLHRKAIVINRKTTSKKLLFVYALRMTRRRKSKLHVSCCFIRIMDANYTMLKECRYKDVTLCKEECIVVIYRNKHGNIHNSNLYLY